MRDFGKLIGKREVFQFRDRAGNIVGESPPVMVLYDANGVMWQKLFAAHPHAWYIAVADDGTIVSMQSDPEQSQIADVRIIGIDSNFGFTTGPNGTVYGKKWDGERIVDAN